MPRARRLLSRVDPVLVWLLVWVAWGVRTRGLYLAGGPVFSLAPEFGPPFLRECGGPARYAGLFLAQLDYYDLLGASLRAVQAGLLGWLTERVLGLVLGRPVPRGRYLLSLPYLLLCVRVDQAPAVGLLLLCTLGTALLATANPWPERWQRWLAQLALTLLLAWGAAGAVGRGGLWLSLAGWGLLTTLAERRRTGKLKLGWVAAFGCPPLLCAGLGARWLPHLRHQPTTVTAALTLALLAAVPVAGLVGTLWTPPVSARRWPLVLAGVLTAALSVRLTVTQPALAQARLDALVLTGRWPEVLARAAAAPAPDRLLLHDLDTALLRSGRLGERMFLYPQDRQALWLPMSVPFRFSYRFRLADQYLAVGRLNSAEYALQNTLPHTGDNPYILQRLAVVYLVKGDLPAARLYLNLLSYDLLHGAWARRYLKLLETDPRLASDAGIAQLRTFALRRDDLLEVSDVAAGHEEVTYYQNVALTHLLDEQPTNRLALDQLMALYLLNGHPEAVARELHRLPACGYRAIPAPWEEAALFTLDQPGARVDLGGLALSDVSRQRYARFKQVVLSHGDDLRAAWPQLAREFSGTWLLYQAQARLSR